MMVSDLYSSLCQLYESSLHSNVVSLCSLIESVIEQNTSLLDPSQLSQFYVMYGDSLVVGKQFRRAECEYSKALQVRGGDVNSETEVKYSLHQCYVALGQTNQAVNVLQSIAAKQRTVKVSMALGQLYHQMGMERPAIAAYREVVRECPMALEAVRSLIQLGVRPKEIQDLTKERSQDLMSSGEVDWLGGWLAGQAALHSRDYSVAVREFRSLEEMSVGGLRANVDLLVDQGLAHHWAGEVDLAIRVLSRASSLDRHLLRGMDSLACLLAQEGHTRQLETLSTRLTGVNEESPQSLIALGHFCHLNKKSPRAVYFAHKACQLDTRNVEALLLKGNVLLDLKKLPDAMNHFRQAMLIASYRFETHKGMVDCYLGLSRQREAVTAATSACKYLSNSPRALTLYATVLLKEPLSVARAKSLLERAAKSNHLPAVYLLVDLLDRELATGRAIDLLQEQLTHSSTPTLHQKLADMLAKNNEEEKAMEHYSKALALDPKNEFALTGLQKMEHNTDGMDTTYDLNEMEEVGSGGRGSPHHQELEDSETEAVWSDGDLNLVASFN